MWGLGMGFGGLVMFSKQGHDLGSVVDNATARDKVEIRRGGS